MKQYIKVLIPFLTACFMLLVVTVFSGCKTEPDNDWEPALDPETERQILTDYAELYGGNPEDYSVDHYYGTYNDFVAVTISGYYNFPRAEGFIAGILFVFNSNSVIQLWNQAYEDGKFNEKFNDLGFLYSVSEINREEIRKINAYHRKIFPNIYREDQMEYNFVDDTVVIVLSKEASLDFKTYTPDDFPEIGCYRVDDSTKGIMELVRKQIEAELTGDWSELQSHVDMGFLVDVEKFRRILDLRLSEKSHKNVVRSIELLGKRKDVTYAGPDWIIGGR